MPFCQNIRQKIKQQQYASRMQQQRSLQRRAATQHQHGGQLPKPTGESGSNDPPLLPLIISKQFTLFVINCGLF